MAGFGRLALLTAAALAVGAALGAATRMEFWPVRSRAISQPANQGSSSAVFKGDGGRVVRVSYSPGFDAAMHSLVADATSELVAQGVSTANYAAVPVHRGEAESHQISPAAFAPRYRLRSVDYRQTLPPASPQLLHTTGAR